MKAGPQAERFGEFVIGKLRDRPLSFFEAVLVGRMKSDRVQALGTALAALTEEQQGVVRRSVRLVLDHAIHDFLFSLGESHNLETGIEVLLDGENIAEQSDGLAGELFGENGWFAKYSKHGPESDPA